MNLREGTLLDHRYELRLRLGQGGQGSVWKAYDRSTGMDRALKIVDLDGQDKETVERARREAHLLKDARHPALVPCGSLFEIPAENLLVLVFDFVRAEALSDIRGDVRLTRVHKLAALRHIARALSYVHSRGIVHRDLKPDNVLVTSVFWEDPAAPDSLKLIDFGIAGPRRAPDGATISGSYGTRAYMAPELFDAPETTAQRSPARDVFAFGVLAFELLYGSHPTELPLKATVGAYQGMYQHFRIGREPWPPRPLEGRWGSLITACLALDPQERPPDGAAIVQLLEEARESRLSAPQAPSVEPVAPPAERRSKEPEIGSKAGDAPPPDVPKIGTEPHIPADGPQGVSSAPVDPEPQKAEGPVVESPPVDAPRSVPNEEKEPLPSPAVQLLPIESFKSPSPPTEIAPLGSLPKSPILERTTPMAPEIAVFSPEMKAEPKEAQPEPKVVKAAPPVVYFPEPLLKKAPEKKASIQPASTTLPAGQAPPPRERRSEEPPEKSVWWTIVVGALLCAIPIAVALWFAWGESDPPPGPPLRALTPGSAQPSVRLSSPPVDTGASPPGGAAVSAAPEEPVAATSEAEKTGAIELCCGKGETKCSSGRPCKPGNCKEHIEPDRTFLLRILGIEEQSSIYEKPRDLSAAREHRNSKVCLHTASPPGVCPSMKSIAARNIAPEDRLLVHASDIIDGRIQVRIKPPKGKGMSATLAPTKGLLTSALCGGVRLKDRKEQLIIHAHLDDPDEAMAAPQ